MLNNNDLKNFKSFSWQTILWPSVIGENLVANVISKRKQWIFLGNVMWGRGLLLCKNIELRVAELSAISCNKVVHSPFLCKTHF